MKIWIQRLVIRSELKLKGMTELVEEVGNKLNDFVVIALMGNTMERLRGSWVKSVYG